MRLAQTAKAFRSSKCKWVRQVFSLECKSVFITALFFCEIFLLNTVFRIKRKQLWAMGCHQTYWLTKSLSDNTSPRYWVVTSVQGWQNLAFSSFPAKRLSSLTKRSLMSAVPSSSSQLVCKQSMRISGWVWFGHTGWASSLHSPENFWRERFGRRQDGISWPSPQHVNLMTEFDL